MHRGHHLSYAEHVKFIINLAASNTRICGFVQFTAKEHIHIILLPLCVLKDTILNKEIINIIFNLPVK